MATHWDNPVVKRRDTLTFLSNGDVQKCKTQSKGWMLTWSLSTIHPITAICNQIRLACLAGWQGGAAAPQRVELHSVQSRNKVSIITSLTGKLGKDSGGPVYCELFIPGFPSLNLSTAGINYWSLMVPGSKHKIQPSPGIYYWQKEQQNLRNVICSNMLDVYKWNLKVQNTKIFNKPGMTTMQKYWLFISTSLSIQ